MTEETALLLLEELQLVNEKLEICIDYFQPISVGVGIVAVLFSLFIGSFIGHMLFHFLKGR